MHNYDLSFEPYCENCPEFDVTVNEEILYLQDFSDPFFHDYETNDNTKKIIRKIECSHKTRCANMVKYLERKYKK